MPTNDVVVVGLGVDVALVSAILRPLQWDVALATDVDAARKVLHDGSAAVGLLLLEDAARYTPQALEALLELPKVGEWVGVFPLMALQNEGYRAFMLRYLHDFHVWPLDPAALTYSLQRSRAAAAKVAQPHARSLGPLASPADTNTPVPDHSAIVGSSQAIASLRKLIAKVAHVDAPVLIWGESGSGKELVAHAIHAQSPRADKRFVAMNCGALPASLIQSELFGYERGAFTGAVRDKRGLIESAHGGTLFLDEVGDLPLELQVILLRFLQEGTIMRVGSSHTVAVDVRVIAASHMHLDEAVRAGRFREDLLYRLNVLPIQVPALRERKEDLEELAQYFFQRFSKDKHPRLRGFGKRALQAMHQHDWPGNVRELINRMRRAMVMAEGRLITPHDLGMQAGTEPLGREALQDARVRAECDAIQVCLQGHRYNKTLAARELGISRMTLYRLMGKHGIHG